MTTEPVEYVVYKGAVGDILYICIYYMTYILVLKHLSVFHFQLQLLHFDMADGRVQQCKNTVFKQ